MCKYLKSYIVKRKHGFQYYLTFIEVITMVIYNTPIVSAQQMLSSSPTSQMEVYVTQQLSFGSFSNGTLGGEITVSPDGSVFVTGSIVTFPDVAPLPAIFEVRSTPNRMVHIILPTIATLTHVQGKANMTVTNFTSDKPNNAFVTVKGSPFINPVNIGGKLKVQNSSINPPGNYRGSFSVTFVSE